MSSEDDEFMTVHAERDRASDVAGQEQVKSRRLIPEEQQRGLAALERMKALSDEIMAERGGVPFSPSWELLNEARDERSRQLG